MPRLLSLIILSFLSATAFAGVYKWVDSDGTVHYSDQPSPDAAKEQTLNIKSGTASDTPGTAATGTAATENAAAKKTGPKSYIEQDAEFRKRQVEAAEKQAKEEKELADAKERQQNCERARTQLTAVQSGARIARYNEKGEKVYLDDAGRPQEAANAQKSVDSWCNPPKK